MIVFFLVRETREIVPMIGTSTLIQQLSIPLKQFGIKMDRDLLFELLRYHGLLIRRRRRMVKTTDSHHWLTSILIYLSTTL